MQQRYRLADHAINYDSRITHHPNIHQVHLPNVNPLVNLYSYIQLSLHYCVSCMTSRVRPLTSMPQGTRDHLCILSHIILRHYSLAVLSLFLLLLLFSPHNQLVQVATIMTTPLANCNRANKSNKDSARKSQQVAGLVGFTDTQPSMLPGISWKRNVRSKFWWFRSRAIRITYRISLRSSSLWEPRHPLLKVVINYFF